MVYFYVNGIKTPVVIDDYLPCSPQNGKPIFARSKGEELWVCLLEKAWAKLYGTYARTEGGDPSFALAHLTGNPAETIWHEDLQNDIDGFWEKIRYADQRNYTMTSGSDGQGENDMGKGIVSGHCYTLISTHEIRYED